MRRSLGAGLCLGMWLAQPAFAQQSDGGDWPTARGNAARTAFAPLATFGEVRSHTGMAWAVPLGAPVSGAAVIAGSTVLVADTTGRLHALDLTTGCSRWTVTIGDPVLGAPTAIRERVVVATRSGWLVAVSLADGGEHWRRRVAEAIEVAPLAMGERVIVATRDGTLLAVSLAEGLPRWSVALDGPCFAAPAGEGDAVCAVTVTGMLSRHSVADGARRWDVRVGAGACYAAPAIVGGRVYSVAGDGVVAAWALKDGERLFRVALDGPASASPAVSDDRLFVVSEDGDCRALDAHDGSEIWSKSLTSAGRFRAGLCAASDWLLVPSTSGTIWLLGTTQSWDQRKLSPAVGGARPILATPALHHAGCVGVRSDGLVFAQRDPSGDRRVVDAVLKLRPPLDAIQIALKARELTGPKALEVARAICRAGEAAYDVLDEIARSGRADLQLPAARWRDHLGYVTRWVREIRSKVLERQNNESGATWAKRRRRLWRTFLVHPHPDVAAAAAARFRDDGGRLEDFDPLWPVAKRRRIVAKLPD